MPKLDKQNLIPTVLVILDGFGLVDPKRKGNAITPATAPNIFGLMNKYPASILAASGKDVGLFAGQPGNSEAGHLNIGAGRVVKQDLLIISEAIADGTFFKNEAFKQALFHVKKYKRAVHVLALLTNRTSAHARPEHLYAMLEFFRREKQDEVYLHLFTDGRDSAQQAALDFLRELRGEMQNHEKIATVTGRFYAMDRNRVWERTKRTYEAIVCGRGRAAKSAREAVEASYRRGETDEFIEPTVILEGRRPAGLFRDNDAIYFINARSDRARQLTKAFVQPDFQKQNKGAFKRAKFPKNTRFVAMTDFGPDLPGIFTAFSSPDVPRALSLAINDNYKQLYISESEKYAHITYFINGGFAASLNGEEREVVKSDTVKSYAGKPEMRAGEVTDKIAAYLKNNKYNFICVNYPNADMVGHSGDFEAAKRAVRFLDAQVKRLVDEVVEKKGGQLFLLADHGNAEEMVNLKTGAPLTEHTNNPVPFLIVRKGLEGKKLKSGRLGDAAPTIFKLMGVEKPSEMTGKCLLE